MVWWPFERGSCRKKSKKTTHSNLKYSINVQNISYLEGGSTNRVSTFHLRFQLLEELYKVNESLISYRTVLSSFSPLFPRYHHKLINFSYFFQVGTWWKPEHEVWRIWIITCLSTTSCPWCIDGSSSCSQNVKFKLFSIFLLFPPMSRLKSLFSTPLCVLQLICVT